VPQTSSLLYRGFPNPQGSPITRQLGIIPNHADLEVGDTAGLGLTRFDGHLGGGALLGHGRVFRAAQPQRFSLKMTLDEGVPD